MKQRMLIFVVLIFLVVILVGLNAATYVQKEKVPDTELAPNRSSYNYGVTGTHAFYSLLSETGRKVSRWQEPLDRIASMSGDRPSVFIMIGPLRRELTDVENTQLMAWVSDGGTLILIDREPRSQLALTTAQWQMSVHSNVGPELVGVDGSDQVQMTSKTPALKASLPSSFTHGVNSVQPSRFASTVALERFSDVTQPEKVLDDVGQAPPPPAGLSETPAPSPYDFYGVSSPDPAGEADYGESYVEEEAAEVAVASLDAPVVHVGNPAKGVVVEAPFASGRVVIVTDPYIVSNAGIGLVDNARLGVNLATSRGGVIAFDEYHHGYGANNNRFLEYFDGTPVMAISLQLAVIVGLVFFSRSRRFARPVPHPEPSRLSKLEYISAMAELQQRTHAYDLAIENIYSDFRRRACVLLGLDNITATRRAIAERAGERLGVPPREIEELLFQCEDVIHGEPVGKKDTVELVERLRALEDSLGLQRSVRKGVQ